MQVGLESIHGFGGERNPFHGYVATGKAEHIQATEGTCPLILISDGLLEDLDLDLTGFTGQIGGCGRSTGEMANEGEKGRREGLRGSQSGARRNIGHDRQVDVVDAVAVQDLAGNGVLKLTGTRDVFRL